MNFGQSVTGASSGKPLPRIRPREIRFSFWEGGEVSDFEFRCLVRFEGNNSGVQYRSSLVDEKSFALSGYQADLHPRPDYIGMMYGEKTGRGIIAKRGQRVVIGKDEKTTVISNLDTSNEIASDQFNELRIVAVGNRLIHQINGVTTVDITDNHPKSARSGLLGLQLHAGPPMKVEFRNLLLRKLDTKSGNQLIQDIVRSTKNSEAPKQDQKAAVSLGENWIQSGKTPNWIWSAKASNGQKVWFRHEFQIDDEVSAAEIYATCDNKLKLFLNGKDAGMSNAWERPNEREVKSLLRRGKNVIAVEGQNEGGIAGLVLKLGIVFAGDKRQAIVSGADWKISTKPSKNWKSADADVSAWTKPKVVGKLGDAPWRIPRASGNKQAQRQRLSPYEISAPPGFLIERIHALDSDQGSWVSLTTDNQGRLYACDQGGKGLYRITVNGDEKPLIEKVSVGNLDGLSGAQGLLWAFDSLWFHRNGGNLFRLTDSDGDGMLDKQEMIPSTKGGGEHGNHALILTEDGKAIYMDGGNHAPLASHERSRVPMWSEGLLLPRMWDARGHARGKLAPGGWVTRLDPHTQKQTVYSIGYRNQYDIALNRHGDMFTYDADMEWDMGMPWYRPTRICFVASGSDYGWRSGSGKWPTYYEDSLPPVVEIGPGSPTGVVSGAGTKFPTRYQDAILALDWTFGTLYAIHLQPDGAGYSGTAEPFIYGSPLPLTDAVVGHDGALYFTVGGRGAASALFRARYVGKEAMSPPSESEPHNVASREMRRRLEAFHGKENPHAVSFAWKHLSSEDRFIRHAARVAVESQLPRTWAHKIRDEPNPQARITAAVALARVRDKSHHELLINSLLSLDPETLSESQLLGLLRAYSLTFIEIGRPTNKQRQSVIAQIDPQLPSDNSDVNTELIRVLTYLKSKSVVAKAMELINHPAKPKLPEWSELITRNAGYGGSVQQMLDNHPPTTELAYAFMLRNVRGGWTLQQRRDYFEFLNEAAKRSGGASYSGFPDANS